ncbi:MAG TPA: DEAD/DEAH box helicase, partial [Candidatus Nanopelagicales bacterium]|nr:DEAD/DEAH box helicase [Candidatus Nanopelagicales bacterium]
MQAGRSARLLGPGGPLAAALEGYEDRPGQLAMAEAVERALEDDRVLLCEAGTGTGKTLAYLVPALLSGRKVVVSTATKALEDQIFTKDLPLIAQHLGIAPQAALVKGLGNYLCLRRYNELRRSPDAGRADVRRALPLLEAWARDTETGDVAELVTLAEGDPIWREVSSSSETRVGAQCAYHEDCFVTKMRREAEEARLVIVNHHLFFADLAVKMAAARRGFGGAGALPRDLWSGELLAAYHRLDDGLEALAGYAANASSDEAVRLVAQRAGQMREDAARIVDPAANQVTWAEARGRGGAGATGASAREAALARADIAVGASPVDLGWTFRDQVFERIGAVVLTSATLTTGRSGGEAPADPAGSGGSFRFLRARMGLDGRATVPVEELEV